MDLGEQRDKIIEQLEQLNRKVARQNAIWHIFITGVIYGFGFVVGSAILASLILGILVPWFADVVWIQTIFERGASFIRMR